VPLSYPPLEKARILVCNDDGVYAPGLRILKETMTSLCAELWVVAPEREHSGAGHSLTLHRPLRFRQLESHIFGVDGTPTDSVLLAVKHIMKDKPPHLVLSGFNAGGNLGEDITYSGTVAAAMEATLLGIPAMALSQIHNYETGAEDWRMAAAYTPSIVRHLHGRPWDDGVFFNINFPHCPQKHGASVEITRQGRHCGGGTLLENVDPRGRTYFWIGSVGSHVKPESGTDLDAISRNAISVTPLHLDLTHHASLDMFSLPHDMRVT